MRAGTVVLGFGFSLLSLGALADMALPAAAPEAARPALHLVWMDAEGIARSFRPAAVAEAASAFEEAGVDARWETSEGEQRVLGPDDFLVVLLPAPPSNLPRETMGAAHPYEPGARVV